MKIYVAGASSERRERADVWMDRLRGEGCTITLDWSRVMDRVLAEEKKNDHELTHADRYRYARADRKGVVEADVFWLLASADSHSPGSWIELGIALGHPCGLIVVSGPGCRKSLFTELADHIFESDEEAFQHLRELNK